MVSKPRVAIVIVADLLLFTAVVMLSMLDRIVHSTLYSYGLIFSDAWAQPYWLLFRVSLVAIMVAILLFSVVELPVPAFQEND